ncbi:hypothetical protein AALP_AA8G028500 [Arabis alpina]|uniref:Uncharacterized protein n=1 Tax=Arabis alpina TaxID=50452 RepID=A0A087G4L4_ARAAL|nr:hypothetical protein AALP_AA8G028500 [Arabis alpina]
MSHEPSPSKQSDPPDPPPYPLDLPLKLAHRSPSPFIESQNHRRDLFTWLRPHGEAGSINPFSNWAKPDANQPHSPLWRWSLAFPITPTNPMCCFHPTTKLSLNPGCLSLWRLDLKP